jgi:hypothetical protein
MMTTLKQNAVTITQAGNDNAPRLEQSVCFGKMPSPPNFLVHRFLLAINKLALEHQCNILYTAENNRLEAQIAAVVQDDDISALSNKEIISKLQSDDRAPSDFTYSIKDSLLILCKIDIEGDMPVIYASIIIDYGLQEKAYLCGMPAPNSHINDYLCVLFPY